MVERYGDTLFPSTSPARPSTNGERVKLKSWKNTSSTSVFASQISCLGFFTSTSMWHDRQFGCQLEWHA